MYKKKTDEILRLYAITCRGSLDEDTFLLQVGDALRGGITCLQMREKEMNDDDFLKEALKLRELCARYDVPFIINDRVDIAIKVQADGVHVGQEDMAAESVRALIGEDMILGVTARTPSAARAAQAHGADYLGSGAMFTTSTKPEARPMTVEELRDICTSVDIPVVAIGGITLHNLPELKGIPVAGYAMSAGIFSAEDITSECRALNNVINSNVTE